MKRGDWFYLKRGNFLSIFSGFSKKETLKSRNLHLDITGCLTLSDVYFI